MGWMVVKRERGWPKILRLLRHRAGLLRFHLDLLQPFEPLRSKNSKGLVGEGKMIQLYEANNSIGGSPRTGFEENLDRE